MTNFIDIKDLSKKDLERIIDDTIEIKKNGSDKFLKNKNVLMIFEKPSLRTRISFEVCINDLGGNSLILNSNEFKFGERESICDSTKVLDRYIDFILSIFLISLESMGKNWSLNIFSFNLINRSGVVK